MNRYEKLDVSYQYANNFGTLVNKYCIRGQRKSDLNWEVLLRGFDNQEDAIKAMKKMNTADLPMFNASGYGIN